MSRQIYIRDNENVIVKPLGINGDVIRYDVHYLPRIEGLNNVSVIECQGENCYMCKVIDWIRSAGVEDVVKAKFKEMGTHFNSAKQSIFIIPAYRYTASNNWSFGYLKLFENQFTTFVNFLEANDMYNIGEPTNSDTLLFRKDRWNYLITKGNIPFMMTDVVKLMTDYEAFLSESSNPANFGIVNDITVINTVNYHIYNYIQRMLQ